MSDTLDQGCFTMPEPFFGSHQFGCKLIEVGSTKVLEFASFQEIPHAFLWIEFRRIAWETFQMDAFGSPLSQKVLDCLAAMDRGPIPNDKQVARDLPQQQLQKAHDIWSFVGVILHLHDQLSLQGQPSNSREMVTCQLDGQHGGLSSWRIGPNDHGQEIKRRLVYKDDGPLFLFGLFFSSAARCSRQVWIACASRWLAWLSGFCKLCLIALRRRPQCVG
jgi:hypothetical protein